MNNYLIIYNKYLVNKIQSNCMVFLQNFMKNLKIKIRIEKKNKLLIFIIVFINKNIYY